MDVYCTVIIKKKTFFPNWPNACDIMFSDLWDASAASAASASYNFAEGLRWSYSGRGGFLVVCNIGIAGHRRYVI